MLAGLVVVMGCSSVLSFGGETAATLPTAEQMAVLEGHRADYARALADGNADGCVAAWADDARLMPEYHPTVFGRSEAGRYYRAVLDRFRVTRYERTPVRQLNLGERLVEFGQFAQELVRKDNGQSRALEGKYVEVWKRTVADGWELIAATWNYSRWPDFADELRYAEVPGVRVALEAHVPVKGGVSFELAALNGLQERAIVEKDHRVWSQFYADDAVLLPNHGTMCEGRSEIDAYLESHVAHMPVYEKLDIRNDRIDDLGDWVVDYASHVATWRNGDASGVNTGKNIRVWRRAPRGGLKMVCQAGTYD